MPYTDYFNPKLPYNGEPWNYAGGFGYYGPPASASSFVGGQPNNNVSGGWQGWDSSGAGGGGFRSAAAGGGGANLAPDTGQSSGIPGGGPAPSNWNREAVAAATTSQGLIGGVDIPPATGFNPNATWAQYSFPAPQQQPSLAIGAADRPSGVNVPTNENVNAAPFFPAAQGANVQTIEDVQPSQFLAPAGAIQSLSGAPAGQNIPTNENVSPNFYAPISTDIPTPVTDSSGAGIATPTLSPGLGAPVDPIVQTGGLTGNLPATNPFAGPTGFGISSGVDPNSSQFQSLAAGGAGGPFNYSPAPDGGTYVYDANWNYISTIPAQPTPPSAPPSQGAPASDAAAPTPTPVSDVATPNLGVSNPNAGFASSGGATAGNYFAAGGNSFGYGGPTSFGTASTGLFGGFEGGVNAGGPGGGGGAFTADALSGLGGVAYGFGPRIL